MKSIAKKIISILLIMIILLSSINIKIVKADEGTQMVANCSRPIDGGLGDSTGEEYKVINWYNNQWEYVFRYPKANVAEKIAQLAVEAANNDHIGYNNGGERFTFWEQLQANNYSPAAITVDCASDCSGSSGMIVRAAGYQCNEDKIKEINCYGPPAMPGNYDQECGFQCFTGSEYTNSPDLLQPGDVLCSVSADHATIYVGDPSNIKVTPNAGPKFEMKGTKIADLGYGVEGAVSGGTAGDQGVDYTIRDFYGGWSYILRYPDQKVAAEIAKIAIKAANNDNIGYDQGERLTYWQQLEANKYDPSKISVPCETDCSAGSSAAAAGAGFLMNKEDLKTLDPANWTGSMLDDYPKHGFEVLQNEGLNDCSYLLAGDILLKSGHTTVFVGNGESSDVGGGYDIDDITINLDEQEFEFSGNPKTVMYSGNRKSGEWIFDKIAEFIDFIVSIISRGILMSLQGWAMSIQGILDASIKFLEGS